MILMDVRDFLYVAIVSVGVTLSPTVAHSLQCPSGAADLALRMLESNIVRAQGKGNDATPLSQIELGIFQQALRESIDFRRDPHREDEWKKYLTLSISSVETGLSAVDTDTGLPLDRLSVGTSMIYQDRTLGKDTYKADITALKQSVRLQMRNANGGLWYFDNNKNLSAYHNLSYLDGMYSYSSFAILAAKPSAREDDDDSFGLAAASKQIQILHDICKTDDGLLVHGYDASRSHAWANPKTGASPVVWARSLSWYTLGLLNALEISRHLRHTPGYASLRQIFVDLSRAQVVAAERSLNLTGRSGVWQVVDRPGAVFSGHANYVEASASCMTVHNLLRGVRCGLLEEEGLRRRARSAAVGIYRNVLQQFLIRDGNGTLGLNGTSDIASLSGDVSYEYYVTRPTVSNNLIGTSAFVLAGIEMARLCD